MVQRFELAQAYCLKNLKKTRGNTGLDTLSQIYHHCTCEDKVTCKVVRGVVDQEFIPDNNQNTL